VSRALPTVVIGGGIIGLATAYKLLCANSRRGVIVLEKEAKVGQHQSGHNSGVLHAGLYYAPGSLKARLAVDGIRQMKRFCEAYGVPHEICGKIVVATSAEEQPRLDELLRRGVANGLSRLRMLSADETREREPHVRCVSSVLVPEEGIVDYPAVCEALVKWKEQSSYQQPEDWVFAGQHSHGELPYWGQAILHKYLRPAAWN